MMTSFRDSSDALTPVRKKQRRRRRIIFWSLTGFFVLILVGIFYLIFFSKVIQVKAITIQGNRVATSDELKQLIIKKLDERGALVRWLGSGNILYWINVHTITDTGIPAAGALTIHTSLIHRTVSVAIQERVFNGVWCSDTCVGFDPNGIAFFLAPQVYGSLLLKVQDENTSTLSLGNPVFNDKEALKNIFETIGDVKASNIAIDTVSIKDISLREWEIQNTYGTVFKFSLDFVPDDLINVFKTLREKTKFENLSYVDFRVKNRVYYK